MTVDTPVFCNYVILDRGHALACTEEATWHEQVLVGNGPNGLATFHYRWCDVHKGKHPATKSLMLIESEEGE